MQEAIVNKVAESGLITINLEDYLPNEDIVVFDLKDYLFKGLILKEKEFRASMLAIDWNKYMNKIVCVTCSTDAIIPVWAYMLVASQLQQYAKQIFTGTKQQLTITLLQKNIEAIDGNLFLDKRVVIKGCGDIAIPESAYVAITEKLRPYAKSIMYGEACSTVPIYKKR